MEIKVPPEIREEILQRNKKITDLGKEAGDLDSRWLRAMAAGGVSNRRKAGKKRKKISAPSMSVC